MTADFLKSKGMKTRDLLELYAELENRLTHRMEEELSKRSEKPH